MIHQRLNAVRAAMMTLRIRALLVTEMAHVRYLSGFSGSNGLCVITPTKQFFITDRRYKTQAPQEVEGFTIIIAKQDLFPLLAEKKLIPRQAHVGFEIPIHLSIGYEKFEETVARSAFCTCNKHLRNCYSGER